MGFQNYRQLGEAFEEGRAWQSWYHKTGGPVAAVGGRWADLSMGAGTPKYNAYVGSQATATPFTGAGNDGIYLPGVPAAQARFLTQWLYQVPGASQVPAMMMLCDYLLHYPLIDGDDTDVQAMDNTLSLTRYTTGAGVQCMFVCTTPMTANANCTVTYTNQDGTAGRTTTFTLLFIGIVGVIVCSANTSAAAGSASPFIPLAGGDSGIRAIESIQIATSAGGFMACVLVKPLAELQYRETAFAVESSRVLHKACAPVRVFDGAYLNFIFLCGSAGAPASSRGYVEFAWG